MKSRLAHRSLSREKGSVLVSVMALVTVLMVTGIAFMHWASDEAVQSLESAAAMQAYYLGQMGIVDQGFYWLRTRQASDLPTGLITLPGKEIRGVGKYEMVEVRFQQSSTGGDFWSQERRYRISCIGVVKVPIGASASNMNNAAGYKNVRRKAVLYVQIRNFADYMYLTEHEITTLNDRIKFMNGDTLQGRVHSNDEIAIMGSPVFFEQVSTTAEDFWRGAGYSPRFLGPDPVFRAARVNIPYTADNLRLCATSQGHSYEDPGKTFHIGLRGGAIKMWRWPTGAPEDSVDNWTVPISTGGTCIFVYGPTEVEGMVQGRVTVGSAETMRLMDNIYYADSQMPSGAPSNPDPETGNMLGLVSEGDIKIANTPHNGRENSQGHGISNTNPNFGNITITAAVVALGESFTFEQQNDLDSGYVCDCMPDDRGTIYLWGSVTQMRRGYVHRSTRNSTGYLKQYQYDNRFLLKRPPGFFDVTDDAGHALFNVVQWGQGKESDQDINHWNIVRYN